MALFTVRTYKVRGSTQSIAVVEPSVNEGEDENKSYTPFTPLGAATPATHR